MSAEIKTRTGGRVVQAPPADTSLAALENDQTDVKILQGTRPFPAGGIVTADQSTITGDGTTAHPLVAIGGSSGNADRFNYTVTGLEPDLSELTIPLPETRADAAYEVTPSQSTATMLLLMNVDASSKTTAHFVLSLSANATAGDVFSFVVSDLTA